MKTVLLRTSSDSVSSHSGVTGFSISDPGESCLEAGPGRCPRIGLFRNISPVKVITSGNQLMTLQTFFLGHDGELRVDQFTN